MATPEGKVKAKVKALLKSKGLWYFMPATGGFGASGVFDIVTIVAGRFVGIECKSDPSKRPTDLQTRCAQAADAAGGVAMLVHCDNIKVLETNIDRISDDPSARFDFADLWPTNSFEAPRGAAA